MPSRKNTAASAQRRVALVVESSLTVGRQMLRGIAEYIRQTGYWSVYYEPGHIQNTLPAWLENWHGDGIIARVRNRRLARRFAKMKLPVVDILGDVPDTGIPSVQVNNLAIAELAATHLLEHGFQCFGFCGIRGHGWSRQRQDAFKASIARSGYACHVRCLPSFYGKAWYSEVERERLAQWIAGLPKPVGIMAVNDWIGQKVLAACRHVGALVPEEVAVIGVDNDEAICEISDPMLSSIVPRHDRVGFYAAELLDRLMQSKKPSLKKQPSNDLVVGVPSIVPRRSTDIQTITDRDMAEAVRFIRENACGDIRVEEVAAHVALSYSTLKRRFRKVLDRSVHDEIMRVRMERVRELLAETKMPLGQIARATGFRHQEYLGVAFKAQIGITPGQYRKENSRQQ
ncbi:MAG: DNA-binding transcriptional regulator [Pirellulales bacterium]|nr:DNA-binding transcriptional regulator [Pirellulales bacterium]